MTSDLVTAKWFTLLVAMALVITSSNYLVQFPINDWLTWAAFTYPVTFLITDLTNRAYGPNKARVVVTCGFIIGVILSYVAADARIAIASGSAFLVSQLIDIQIFQRFRHAAWWQAPAISSCAGSCLDTVLFFSIAFYATDVPWVTLALGDLLAKFVMLVLLLPAYKSLVRTLVSRNEPVNQSA